MSLQVTQFEKALGAFPSSVQTEIHEILFRDKVVPSPRVAAWLDIMGIEIGTLMMQLLPVASGFARVPISGFQVGAVALGMPPEGPIVGPGSLYLGSNMEFPTQALSLCVHGEQSATNHAWLAGETGLQALAINAAPCGYCRQFLYELTTAQKGFQILLKASQDPKDYAYSSHSLTYFLPDAFGPSDLGLTGGLMEPEAHGLQVTGGDSLVKAALEAANACYAPYTKDYAGVALLRSDGKVFAGRYAENAAYNPSLSPLDSALAYLNMQLAPLEAYDIQRAVLVEASAKISQKGVTEDVLASVAPGLGLEFWRAS